MPRDDTVDASNEEMNSIGSWRILRGFAGLMAKPLDTEPTQGCLEGDPDGYHSESYIYPRPSRTSSCKITLTLQLS